MGEGDERNGRNGGGKKKKGDPTQILNMMKSLF